MPPPPLSVDRCQQTIVLHQIGIQISFFSSTNSSRFSCYGSSALTRRAAFRLTGTCTGHINCAREASVASARRSPRPKRPTWTVYGAGVRRRRVPSHKPNYIRCAVPIREAFEYVMRKAIRHAREIGNHDLFETWTTRSLLPERQTDSANEVWKVRRAVLMLECGMSEQAEQILRDTRIDSMVIHHCGLM